MQTTTNTPTNSENLTDALSEGQLHTCTTFAITSGKGGVGKTNLATNLAITLARHGSRVCIFDADTGLANINILLGLSPKFTIEHVLDGSKTIQEILVDGPEGIKLIPGASGIANCADLSRARQKNLLDALKELEQQFDYLLIDTAAGIGAGVTRFISASQHIIMVITPEPTSLTDSFAMLRVLKKQRQRPTINVVVNMANSYEHSREIYHRFNKAVKKYLNLDNRFMGYVTRDEYLRNAVSLQIPILVTAPSAMASRCIDRLGDVIVNHFRADASQTGFSDYWQQVMTGSPTEATPRPVSIEDIHLQVNVFLQQHYNTQDAIELVNMIISQIVDHAEREKDTLTDSESLLLAEQADHLIAELCKLTQTASHTAMTGDAQNMLNRFREMTAKIHQQREILDEKLNILNKALE